jgi:hypothetical protein
MCVPGDNWLPTAYGSSVCNISVFFACSVLRYLYVLYGAVPLTIRRSAGYTVNIGSAWLMGFTIGQNACLVALFLRISSSELQVFLHMPFSAFGF